MPPRPESLDTEASIRAILDRLPALIGYWDRDLRNQMANAAHVEFYGRTPEEMHGIHISEILGPERFEDDPKYIERALAGERQTFDREIRIPSGELRYTQATYIPDLVDGTVRGFFALVTDVTERRGREAEETALAAVATLVAQGAKPAAGFEAVAERLGALFDASAAAVTRFDPAGRGVVIGGWSASGDDLADSSLDLAGSTAAAEVFRTGQPARWDSPQVGQGDPASRAIERLAISGAIAAPIFLSGSLWGTIVASFSDQRIRPGAEQRLARFAQLVSIALANAHAWDALERQASTDSLTGVANHRIFHAQLRAEVARAQRYGRNLSLVLIDVDRFKAVNDEHGHLAGDRVLTEVARRLEAQAREGELIARIGGEEFAWLMPETTQQGAYFAAERVRRAIEREPFAIAGTLTVSAGVSSFGGTGTGEQLVRRADRALYRAKADGRNTTCLASTDA